MTDTFLTQVLPFDRRATDVMIQLDIAGVEISIRAWQIGTPKPDVMLEMTDDRYDFGNIGLAFTSPGNGLNGLATVRWFEAFEVGVHGDFNGDQLINFDDYSLLADSLETGETRMIYDVTDDGFLDEADRTSWINDIMNAYKGDSNLDGEFNSSDFVQVFGAGQYDDNIVGNSTWETGDWDGDGEFNSSDFVVAFQEGGYEQGPRPAAITPVPEPRMSVLILGSLVSLLSFARRNALAHDRCARRGVRFIQL